MPKILPLSDQVIAQIAAGEVIERPVFAVKELVENAIDADADSITIHIQESGLKKIQVIDNGHGMNAEDLLEAFKPHTTSKITDDLIGIRTLGFRGEALASIAAVSTMHLQSKTITDTAGTQILLKHGEIEDITPLGMPPGTIITINHLFSSIPARKKFLKSERTEFRHIVELISQYTLSYPHIRFLLSHNKRLILDLPKNQTLSDRLSKLLGISFVSHLIPLLSDPSYIEVSGFLARPQLSTKSQSRQFIFVNNRLVTDRLILTAVKEAYGNLLESTHFPIFVLSLRVPHEMVDVNVHPRKEQVSFVNAEMIFQTVKLAVTKTLSENNLTFSHVLSQRFSPRIGSTKTYASAVLKEEVIPWSVKEITASLKNAEVKQIYSLYLLLETKNGLILIDQHAAHERVLFEQYKAAYAEKKKLVTNLLTPVLIDVSPSEYQTLIEHLSHIASLGLTLEPFSGNTLKLTTLPEILKDQDPNKVIQEILDELLQGKPISDIESFMNRMLTFLACKSAIKAGELLTQKEAKRLIQKLETTKNNATCPHGRPTKVIVSLSEINSLFKRK